MCLTVGACACGCSGAYMSVRVHVYWCLYVHVCMCECVRMCRHLCLLVSFLPYSILRLSLCVCDVRPRVSTACVVTCFSMCECRCVYICVYWWLYVYLCMCECLSIRPRVCLFVFICVTVDACACVFVGVYMYMCVYVRVNKYFLLGVLILVYMCLLVCTYVFLDLYLLFMFDVRPRVSTACVLTCFYMCECRRVYICVFWSPYVYESVPRLWCMHILV